MRVGQVTQAIRHDWDRASRHTVGRAAIQLVLLDGDRDVPRVRREVPRERCDNHGVGARVRAAEPGVDASNQRRYRVLDGASGNVACAYRHERHQLRRGEERRAVRDETLYQRHGRVRELSEAAAAFTAIALVVGSLVTTTTTAAARARPGHGN